MPCYLFDLQSGADETGVTLPDAPAARRMAMRYAGELIRDMEPPPSGKAYWRMDVREEGGPVLFSLVLDLVPGIAGRAEADRPETQRKRFANGGRGDWEIV